MYATCDFFRYAREVGTQTSPKKFGGIPFYDCAYNQYGRVEEALCLIFAMLIVRIFVWVILYFLVWCGYYYWDWSSGNLGLDQVQYLRAEFDS